MLDKLKEECGIFAIYNSEDAASNTALGLHALQHRGQEASGIVSMDGDDFASHFAEGLVSDNFTSINILNKLKGNCAIGHVRYSTIGDKGASNFQPIYAQLEIGFLALAHNGNLTNIDKLRSSLIKNGSIFQSTMDSEVIIHLIALSKKDSLEDKVIDAISKIEGAYSLVLIHKNKIFAIRDPYGVRPLVIGKLGESIIFASESCALDIVGAKFVRNVKKGEMVIADENGLRSLSPLPVKPSKFCIFEYIYFARPDSNIENKNVYDIRRNIGIELAKENQIDADVVVPVPDSGVPAAIGFAFQSKISFELGIIRNHYVGRTFIEPTDKIRNFGVKLKHNANCSSIKGKRVILIDDSIVRGTTSKKIVNMIRDAGAKEVYLLIASPPTISPCYYGVDTPQRDKLIAASNSVEKIAELINADKVSYISIDGLYRALQISKRDYDNPQYCDACFSENYPIKIN